MLEPLGLSELDSTVYRLALRHRTWDPDRFAAELDTSADAVRASFGRLVERGLVREDPSGPTGFYPLGPDMVLDVLLAEDEVRTAQHHEQIERLRAELSSLVGEYLAAQTELVTPERIERVDGVDAVRLRLEELARQTSQEVLSLHPGGAQSADSIRASLPLDRRALQSGVTMRAIYLHEIVADPSTWSYVQEVAAHGAEVRTSWDIPTRLTIIDRRVGVLPAEQESSGGSALIIQGTGIVTALAALFHQCWRYAQPLLTEEAGTGTTTASTAEGGQPSEHDRFLVRMLSLGLKDEAIARHLGVSVRTVRRQIGDVFDQLNASSRFQAGVEAANRGWITGGGQ